LPANPPAGARADNGLLTTARVAGTAILLDRLMLEPAGKAPLAVPVAG
jgi:hypothetical protein